MSGRTTHYGWKKVQAGDSLTEDGYEYTFADREDIDGKAWLGAEGHHHTGGVLSSSATPAVPSLVASTTGGRIPAGTTVYYKIALVNTQNQESVASTETHVTTPAAIVEPNAATLTYTTTGGALLGGDYYYVLSAYVGISTSETKALSSTFLSVNSVTGTNKVTLTLPTRPAGATGFNIYRRAPGETKYFYLTSTTSTTTYVDNGSLAENCDRTVPPTNSTNAQNSIIVSYPGATPVVPTGYTWKIYRTYLNGIYTRSLLVHVVEFTSEATPVITPTYTDTGIATSAGSPLATVTTVTNPSKILLTDGAEAQGTLPMGLVSGHIETFAFAYSGYVAIANGTFTWVCEYPTAQIVAVRASLGRGYAPASQAVIVDINKGSGSLVTPSYQSIFATSPEKPTVPVGSQVGNRVRPTLARAMMTQGDVLTADILQAGGGATPTDKDLTITVTVIGYGYPSTSFSPGSTPTGY